MSLTNKLVNPTPFNVKIPYEKGIDLKIPSDGEIELTIEQMDDYRPGKPGSEEVRKMLNYHGLFLMDGDRSYDSQALQAIKASYTEKTRVVNDFKERLQTNRTTSNRSIDDQTLTEITNKAGYGVGGIGDQVKSLKKRIDMLEKIVAADKSQGKVKDTLDPERTCFITKPPRQFPSKIALAMFLEENPDIKKEHEEFVKAGQEMK